MERFEVDDLVVFKNKVFRITKINRRHILYSLKKDGSVLYTQIAYDEHKVFRYNEGENPIEITVSEAKPGDNLINWKENFFYKGNYVYTEESLSCQYYIVDIGGGKELVGNPGRKFKRYEGIIPEEFE